MRRNFTPLEVTALCMLLLASFCGLAAAEESPPSTLPAGRQAHSERVRNELNPSRYRTLDQERLADYQTKLDTFLIKTETRESGKSVVASEPRAADAQAVIDASKAVESARALEAARKLIAAPPDRADLADLRRIAPQLEIDRNGIVRYAGTFEKDIRFQASLAATPKHIEDGYGILEQRLGIDLRNYANVLIQFKDSGFKPTGGVKAHTRIVGSGDKQNTMIEFFTEYVVNNPEVFRRTVVHEMKHAGFAEMMGGRAYGCLPGWIKEGLAIWGSEDADTRVTLVLANTAVSGGDPMRVLDGIEEEGKDNNDFLEGSLAFEWLESRKAGNVKAFCQRLVKGEPYREIWADIVGTSYEKAIALADEYCHQRVNEALGEAYAAFVPLQKGAEAAVAKGAEAAKAWLADGGEADLKKWLETHRLHPAAPFGRLWLGRALVDAGRHDDGRAVLQLIINEDVERCTLLDDAQFFIGYSYNLQGDAKALEAFGVLLRDFPYSVHAKQFIGKLPPAGPVTQ